MQLHNYLSLSVILLRDHWLLSTRMRKGSTFEHVFTIMIDSSFTIFDNVISKSIGFILFYILVVHSTHACMWPLAIFYCNFSFTALYAHSRNWVPSLTNQKLFFLWKKAKVAVKVVAATIAASAAKEYFVRQYFVLLLVSVISFDLEIQLVNHFPVFVILGSSVQNILVFMIK